MGFEIDLIAARLRRETIMKRRTPIRDRAALSVEIGGLSKASIKDLRERWKTLYGKAPCGAYRPVLFDSGDRLPPPGAGFRRTQTLDPSTAGSGR